MEILGGGAESLIIISPKTRQKYNKENRKPLTIKDFRFLLCDSVGNGKYEGGETWGKVCKEYKYLAVSVLQGVKL